MRDVGSDLRDRAAAEADGVVIVDQHTGDAAHAEVDKVLAEGYRGTGKEELLVGAPEAVVERLRAAEKIVRVEIAADEIGVGHEVMVVDVSVELLLESRTAHAAGFAADTIPGTNWTGEDWRIFDAKVRWAVAGRLDTLRFGGLVARFVQSED